MSLIYFHTRQTNDMALSLPFLLKHGCAPPAVGDGGQCGAHKNRLTIAAIKIQ